MLFDPVSSNFSNYEENPQICWNNLEMYEIDSIFIHSFTLALSLNHDHFSILSPNQVSH